MNQLTDPSPQDAEASPPATTAKKKRSRWRVLLRVVLAGVLLGGLLIAAAPTLLSTGPGTRWLVSLVSDRVDGDLTIDDLKLSWLGGQRIEGLSYEDRGRGTQVAANLIEANDVGLLTLVRGGRELGTVVVLGGEFVYTEQVAAQDDAAADFGDEDSVGSDEPFKLPQDFAVRLVVRDTTLRYVAEGIEPVVVTLDDESISVPSLRDIDLDLTAAFVQGQATGRVELVGTVADLFDASGFVQAEHAAYDVNFTLSDLPIHALDRVLSGLSDSVDRGRVVGLLGDGKLTSDASIKGAIDSLASDFTVKAPKLHVELYQRTQGNTLIASPESFARLQFDQSGLLALFPESGLELVEPTTIDLASVQMQLPIVGGAVDWQRASASLRVEAGENLAVVDPRGEVLQIDALRLTGESDSIAEELAFKLTTELSTTDDQGVETREPVAVDLIVRQPLEPTREVDFFSKALPIRLADALVGQDGRLVVYLGELLALQADLRGSVTTDAQGTPRVVQYFSLRPDGRLTGTVAGSFSEGRFTLETPANEPIEAVLMPEAFANLMEMLSGKAGEPALTIGRPMPVYLTLSDEQRGPVSITTRGDKAGIAGFFPDPDRTRLGATVELSPATVYDPKLDKTYELRGGSLLFSAPDLRGEVQVRAELDLWVRPDAGQAGVASLLTWQTKVTDLLDSDGRVPLDGKALLQQISASGGMRLDNAPSGLMDSLLSRDGDLASILGPIVQQMEAGFTYRAGQPTGATVRLNWDEANDRPVADSWASMKPVAFDIDAEQMLTVRGGQDIELQVRVTEQFGDRWMGKLHPILFDAKSGDRPVTIKVDGQSFRFPLKGEKMRGSRVEATVDLGTIDFGNDALLGKLMQWADRPGERAVFSPAKISLVDGNIAYDALDLAVGNVKLRLDGQLDVATGQIVDMAVRVPGDSLIRVFNELEGVIKPDDYLSIPMTGAIRQPTFDSRLIGQEVARLVARGLIDEQKNKLGDLIRKGIGGDDKPDPKPDGPDGDRDGGGQDPADPADEVADELINRGLDLLFRRLGGQRDQPKEE